MNTYMIYFKESKESYGPFQAISRNNFRLLENMPWEEFKQVFQPLTEIAVVDPNGAVLMADMLIEFGEKGDLGHFLIIIPKHTIVMSRTYSF